MPVPDAGKIWRCEHSFRYNSRIWRTDGWNCHNNIAFCMHRHADAR